MEKPTCNYCNSDFNNHTTIYTNVKNTKHNLVECNNCKLRFYSPRIPFKKYIDNGFGINWSAKEEAERMYKNGSFSVVDDTEKQKLLLQKYYQIHVIDKIFSHNPNISSIYEIGSSVGWLSHFIKEQYPNIEFNGCELNKYSVQIANDIFGLNVSHGVFDTVEVKKNYYDVILAMDFIEHTFTPFDDLKKCYSILNPNGIIVLKTFLEELDIDRIMECPIGHSHHFFGHVLKKMIEDCKFEILQWKIEKEQVTIIAKKLM